MNSKFKLVLLVYLCFTAIHSFANYTGLSAEIHTEDAITGYTTYRIYADFDDTGDQLVSIGGSVTNPMSVATTGDFYQNALGGGLASNINTFFFAAEPNLEFDSWMTIGITDQSMTGLNSANMNFTAFEAGGTLLANTSPEGAIFIVPGAVPEAFATSGRVLLGQLTTNGDLSLQLNLVWRNSSDVETTVNGETLNVVFSLPGCNDPNADNYNVNATEDDGSCTYPAPSYNGLSYELIASNGVAGYETYRVYANFTNPLDQVVTVYGQDVSPLSISSTGTIYQDANGGPTSSDINPAFFPGFPSLEYDSWVTIGTESAPNGLSIVGVDFTDFEAGNALTINDPFGGGWFVIPGMEPTAFPDVSGRVLLGQISTDGTATFAATLQYRAQDGNSYVETETIVFPNAVSGCTNASACNYNPAATNDDGSCLTNDACGVCGGPGTVAGCTDLSACNYNAAADCDDGSCVLPDGCTNATACNYNVAALCDDGSCVLPDGCTDVSACNYNVAALCDDGSCLTNDACGVCGGSGTVAGCTNASACNYNAAADCDDGSCSTNDACSVCGGSGTVAGCTDASACNYNAAADCDDGSCSTNDACGVCGGSGTVAGCTDVSACNYNAAADCDDGSCSTNDACGVCGGSGTVAGCTDVSACNYNAAADCDDGSCSTNDACGVCGGSGTVAGCTDVSACNYNAAADCDDGSCSTNDACGVCGGSGTVAGCTDVSACNYNAAADCDDGSCLTNDACGNCGGTDTSGCTNPMADNYDVDADCDDGSCIKGGCTYNFAFNYDPAATYDDGSCTEKIEGCIDDTALNYDSNANTDDGSCEFEVMGCTDCGADNYNPLANTDDGSCVTTPSGCAGDFTGDGFITVADLTGFLGVFGSECPAE